MVVLDVAKCRLCLNISPRQITINIPTTDITLLLLQITIFTNHDQNIYENNFLFLFDGNASRHMFFAPLY